MKVKAEFFSLRWIKGEPGHLVQGVKNGCRPRGAVRGGNGSFIVKGAPPELNLTVKTSKGICVKNDIYEEVMIAAKRKRMSDSFYSYVESLCESIEFEVSDNCVIDISELLNKL